jgi:hypothetical protein
MARLGRLGWAAGFATRSFGVRVGVRTTDASLLPRAETLLPPGATATKDPRVDELWSIVAGGPSERGGRAIRRLFVLYRGYLRIGRHRELEPVLDALESDMRLRIAEVSPNRVFVHAGVVGWKGRAIVIPGASYSGKSTLVHELVKAGATYYSDEYAVLDARGRVHPFPAALSMREPGGFEGIETEVDGKTGTKPLPVGLVVITRYREATKRWTPKALSPAEGALAMLSNTVSARRDPSKAISTLRAAVDGASVLKGNRCEAAEVAGEILERAPWVR